MPYRTSSRSAAVERGLEGDSSGSPRVSPEHLRPLAPEAQAPARTEHLASVAPSGPDGLWERVAALVGRSLPTAHGSRLVVVRIDDWGVRVRRELGGPEIRLRRQDVERAGPLLAAGKGLPPRSGPPGALTALLKAADAGTVHAGERSQRLPRLELAMAKLRAAADEMRAAGDPAAVGIDAGVREAERLFHRLRVLRRDPALNRLVGTSEDAGGVPPHGNTSRLLGLRP